MKRLFVAAVALALAGTLSACGAPPASPGSNPVTSHLAAVEARYRQARAFVDLFVALAAPGRQREIHAIEARIDAALARARTSATIAEQLLELRAAEAHIAELGQPR